MAQALQADPPLSFVYQHSDTIKAAPSYADFELKFKEQSSDSELESAVVNLWLVLRMHAYRYKILRSAINELQIAVFAFAASASLALALGLIR